MPSFSSVRKEHVGYVSEDTLFFLGPHKPFPGTISTLYGWTFWHSTGLYVRAKRVSVSVIVTFCLIFVHALSNSFMSECVRAGIVIAPRTVKFFHE